MVYDKNVTLMTAEQKILRVRKECFKELVNVEYENGGKIVEHQIAEVKRVKSSLEEMQIAIKRLRRIRHQG